MKSRAEQPLPRHGNGMEVPMQQKFTATTDRAERLFTAFMSAAEERMIELRGFGLTGSERAEIEGDFAREYPELANEAG